MQALYIIDQSWQERRRDLEGTVKTMRVHVIIIYEDCRERRSKGKQRQNSDILGNLQIPAMQDNSGKNKKYGYPTKNKAIKKYDIIFEIYI